MMSFARFRILALLAVTSALGLFAHAADAQVYNRFGPATGILKGDVSTYITTPAVSADVRALWTGTCNSTTYLRADGSCQVPAGTGVTSVGLTVPSGLSVTGSPVTGSGTLGITTALNGLIHGNGSGFTAGTAAVADGGTGAVTLSGVLKGNTTSPISAAASADVIALWTGTCNSTTYLRADGSCQPSGSGTAANPTASVGLATVNGAASTYMRSDGAPALSQSITPTWSALHTFSVAPSLYPTSSLETAASVSPTAKQYSYGDPRRAPGYYGSAGWTDFGDVPTFVDATHITVPTDQTARYTPQRNIMVLGASSRTQARVVSSAYSVPNTTITLSTATISGTTIPTTPIALWLQTSHPSDAPPSSVFNLNDITGMQLFNTNQGTLAASRYAAWTTDAAGVANSAVALVSVSPQYSGAPGCPTGCYLANGWPTGTGRAVLYTPPSFPMEIGTSDVARIKIPYDNAQIQFLNPASFTNQYGGGMQSIWNAQTGSLGIQLQLAGALKGYICIPAAVSGCVNDDAIGDFVLRGAGDSVRISGDNGATSGIRVDSANQVTLGGGAGGTVAKIKGGSTGASNTGLIGFYESNGTTRKGYVGDASSGDSNIYLAGDSGAQIRLVANAGAVQQWLADTDGSFRPTGGTACGDGCLSAQAINVGTTPVATRSTGSFTATLTGMSGATTGTMNYRIVGNIVYLWAQATISGTSNSNAFTITGLPGAITPANNHTALGGAIDNGISVGATFLVQNTSVIQVGPMAPVGVFIQLPASGWTTSGTKGVGVLTTISYPLD